MSIEQPENANNNNDQTKECPFCGETIKAKAIKCRYCGSDLVTNPQPQSCQFNSAPPPYQPPLEIQNPAESALPPHPEQLEDPTPFTFASVVNFNFVSAFFLIVTYVCIGSAIYYMCSLHRYLKDCEYLRTHNEEINNLRESKESARLLISDSRPFDYDPYEFSEQEREIVKRVQQFATTKYDVSNPKYLYNSMIFFGISNIIYFLLIVFYVYKAWGVIQDGYAQTTPGKAAGFLFIPFFNLYWIFVAYYGISVGFNRYFYRHKLNAKPCSKGFVLTVCILWILTSVTGIIPYVSQGLAILFYVLNLFVVLGPFNTVTRFLMCRHAAEQGDDKAQCELGRYYGFYSVFGKKMTSKNSPVQQDMDEAVKWWTKAAEQGNQQAVKLLEMK